jgi:hypothetical protein
MNARVVAYFQNISTDGAGVVIAATNSATNLTLLSSSEQPISAARMIGGLNGNSTGLLTYDFNLARVQGRSTAEYRGSDNTQSQFGASPPELDILHVFVYNMTGGTVNVQSEIKILYDVELFDALELVES